MNCSSSDDTVEDPLENSYLKATIYGDLIVFNLGPNSEFVASKLIENAGFIFLSLQLLAVHENEVPLTTLNLYMYGNTSNVFEKTQALMLHKTSH